MSTTRRRPVFYLLGDSLTQEGAHPGTNGWSAELQDAHIRSVDVINRGLSGYNTRWFVEHALPTTIDELQTTFAPSLVTLWFGTNDAALRDGPKKSQHVPIDEYRANLVLALRALVPLLPTHAQILLITPPPVIDDARRACSTNGRDLDRSDAAVIEYARACVAVGEAEGVSVLDLHTLLSAAHPVAADLAALFGDGLHFSARGNALVAQHIASKITEMFGAAEAARFDSFQLPAWRDLCA